MQPDFIYFQLEITIRDRATDKNYYEIKYEGSTQTDLPSDRI